MANLYYPKVQYIRAIMVYTGKSQEESEKYFTEKLKQHEEWRLDFMVGIVRTFQSGG